MKEKQRLEALKNYEILDTPPDGTFDHIVKLTSQLLNVPIAIISLVDTDRIWFKSQVGLDVQQIDRKPGLCSSAILSSEMYVIEDTRLDPRSLANPLVAMEHGFRFYAAAPLITKDGFNLGTLCVIDKTPRVLSKEHSSILKQLAVIVMNQMELRLKVRQVVSLQSKLAQLVTHNLKGFTGNIPALIEVLREQKDNKEQFEFILKMLLRESEKNHMQIVEFLDQSAHFGSEISYNFKTCDFNELVSIVINTNDALAKNKNQTLELKKEEEVLLVNVDEVKMTQAIDNMINNAIKYSSKNTHITAKVSKKQNKALLEITDQGQGLTDEDKSHLFTRFGHLSAQPTGGELSSGIGLWMTKEIIDSHQGKIKAESSGKNKGTTFRIELNLEA